MVDVSALAGLFLLGGASAAFPDILDPPNGPTHRGAGHSLVAIAGLISILNRLRDDSSIAQEYKDFLYSMITAYGSHLALDAQTPAGLPLLD